MSSISSIVRFGVILAVLLAGTVGTVSASSADGEGVAAAAEYEERPHPGPQIVVVIELPETAAERVAQATGKGDPTNKIDIQIKTKN